MPLATGDVIGILGDNLRLRSSVLPLSRRRCRPGGREGLGLPRGGETVLYTGDDVPAHPLHRGSRQGRAAPRRLAARQAGPAWLAGSTASSTSSAFMARPVREGARSLRPGARSTWSHLLRAAGVEFGVLYEDDLYSGALAYDLGLDEVFADHARRVAAMLRRHGVRRADHDRPAHHERCCEASTRRYLPASTSRCSAISRCWRARASARTDTAPAASRAGVALHDSCVFARYEGMVDEPRELLARGRPHRARTGAQPPPDLVLRRPRRIALSRRRRRPTPPSASRSCAARRPTP